MGGTLTLTMVRENGIQRERQTSLPFISPTWPSITKVGIFHSTLWYTMLFEQCSLLQTFMILTTVDVGKATFFLSTTDWLTFQLNTQIIAR